MLAGWVMQLQEYGIDLQYQPGEKHQHVDALTKGPINRNPYRHGGESTVAEPPVPGALPLRPRLPRRQPPSTSALPAARQRVRLPTRRPARVSSRPTSNNELQAGLHLLHVVDKFNLKDLARPNATTPRCKPYIDYLENQQLPAGLDEHEAQDLPRPRGPARNPRGGRRALPHLLPWTRPRRPQPARRSSDRCGLSSCAPTTTTRPPATSPSTRPSPVSPTTGGGPACSLNSASTARPATSAAHATGRATSPTPPASLASSSTFPRSTAHSSASLWTSSARSSRSTATTTSSSSPTTSPASSGPTSSRRSPPARSPQHYLKTFQSLAILPSIILTDRGSGFDKALARAIAEAWAIDKRATSAYHPQCNGMPERFNQTLAAMLAKLLGNHQEDWTTLLQPLSFAYNSAHHPSIGMAPVTALYGLAPTSPLVATLGRETTEPGYASPSLAQDERAARLKEIWQFVQQFDRRTKERQKKTYDAKHDIDTKYVCRRQGVALDSAHRPRPQDQGLRPQARQPLGRPLHHRRGAPQRRQLPPAQPPRRHHEAARPHPTPQALPATAYAYRRAPHLRSPGPLRRRARSRIRPALQL